LPRVKFMFVTRGIAMPRVCITIRCYCVDL